MLFPSQEEDTSNIDEALDKTNYMNALVEMNKNLNEISLHWFEDVVRTIY